MPLQAGSKAPVFNSKDIFDRYIDLEKYRGKRLLLGFFRHAGCPFCNLRVHTLQKIYDELKPIGFEMIFFFESKANVILRSSFHQGVSPIPIIADPDKKFYGMYGLEPSVSKALISHVTSFIPTVARATTAKVPVHMMASGESFSTMPAEFLIDNELTIRRVHYAERLNQRIEVEDIRKFAREGIIVDVPL